jgi:acylphosphatase
MKKRAQIIVKGLVQGVFFRATTKEVAKSLGLTGWVRNVDDDKVEIVVEGEEEKIKKLIEWSWKGPPAARVDDVKVNWQNFLGEFSTFEIKYDL